VDISQIAELLQPFLCQAPGTSIGPRDVLSTAQLQSISTYIDLLLRWNSRVNLTAVREPREIVTRHFGESFFAARCVFPRDDYIAENIASEGQSESRAQAELASIHVLDLGSGAGFPGIPVKIWEPHVRLTLVESNFKKVTFLREVVRTLRLSAVEVPASRAENFRAQAEVVTLRAVERFDSTLPTAARLVAASGRLAILIGEGQVHRGRELTPGFQWGEPIPIPQSSNRILMIGYIPG
jgi:16S rRNA (guanine527-N7)-methyltransferase